MLKQRIATAVCLAAVFAWAVFAEGDLGFTVLMGVVAIIAGWEWSRLSGLRSSVERGAYMVVVAVVALSPVYLEYSDRSPTVAVAVVTVFWLGVTAFMLRNRAPKELDNRKSPLRMLVGLLLLTVVTWCTLWLRNSPGGQPLLLVYALSIVWIADIGAYFVGRALGKHKLASNISPGKTWEGFAGGMAGVIAWTALVVASGYFAQPAASLVLASLLAGLLSVSGDLLESYLKRSVHIKDSGRILPGHGGVLDRIDGVLAAIPAFVLIIVLA